MAVKGPKYTLNRYEQIGGWLVPLVVALFSIFMVLFAQGTIGDLVRQ